MSVLSRKIFYFLILFVSVNAIGLPAFTQVTDTSRIKGVFKITKIVDGDTFRFENLDKSTRLLHIDTEETYKGKDALKKTNDISIDWNQIYEEEKNKKGTFSVKIESPFGYETWKWTEDFLKDIDSIRLEKDDDNRAIDIYGRLLVYAFFIAKDGKEYNYNIECVRAGYSPYFNKYGNSKRFHKEFIQAQQYAIENRLGIWNPDSKCYPDYVFRIKWWNVRAEQIMNFEKKYTENENFFNLSNDGEFDRLKNYEGKNVTVFANISEICNDKFPYTLKINYSVKDFMYVLINEEDNFIYDDLNLEVNKHYYVYVKGILAKKGDLYYIELKTKDNFWTEN